MWRSQLQEDESRLEAEKRVKYKGTARIKLKWLHLETDEEKPDVKNVEKLKSILRSDCCRFDANNFIAAVIEQQALDVALELSGISAQQLCRDPPGGYPELVFPAGYRVDCLHGRHRIQAAKELDLEWWMVDLYLAGILIFPSRART